MQLMEKGLQSLKAATIFVVKKPLEVFALKMRQLSVAIVEM